MLQAIKKRTLSTLTDHGIPKSHERFRELYARVTRGTEFALVSSSPLFHSTILQPSFPSSRARTDLRRQNICLERNDYEYGSGSGAHTEACECTYRNVFGWARWKLCRFDKPVEHRREGGFSYRIIDMTLNLTFLSSSLCTAV